MIEGQCSDTESDFVFAGGVNDTLEKSCETKLTFKGKAACPLITNPVYEYTTRIPKQLGILSIVFGVVLCFFGSKLLMYFFVLGATLGLLVVTNLYVYNIYLPVDSSVALSSFVLILVSVLSLALSHFLLEFS